MKNHRDFDSYEEVSEQEQEQIDSYMDEEIKNHMKEKEKEEKKIQKANEKILEEEYSDDDLEEYEIEDDFKEEKEDNHYEEYLEKKNQTLFSKIMNILFIVIFVIIILAIIDVVCVAKFNKGPFFAIPIYTHDDGGTKEYYGLGYKVIKYNQVQGRRDMELGTWSLKYNVDPIYIEMLDLAIEFNDNEKEALEKYNRQLLVVSGTLKTIDSENNQITMEYADEGGKYSLNLVCKMETEKEKLEMMEPGYEVSAMGTMMSYSYKTENTIPTIYLENCFAEQ
ncbi:MAG: hypothetical protein J6X28_03895 [Bacilli bacterium]|nr:hypothetical protein [Bacilli bacterium]